MFTFRSHIFSSIYTRDENFNIFMRDRDKAKVVQNMSPEVQFQHFPLLLNRLFEVLVTRPEEIGREAFISILHVLRR
jgi:hypothetical protein